MSDLEYDKKCKCIDSFCLRDLTLEPQASLRILSPQILLIFVGLFCCFSFFYFLSPSHLRIQIVKPESCTLTKSGCIELKRKLVCLRKGLAMIYISCRGPSLSTQRCVLLRTLYRVIFSALEFLVRSTHMWTQFQLLTAVKSLLPRKGPFSFFCPTYCRELK